MAVRNDNKAIQINVIICQVKPIGNAKEFGMKASIDLMEIWHYENVHLIWIVDLVV